VYSSFTMSDSMAQQSVTWRFEFTQRGTNVPYFEFAAKPADP